MNKFILSYFIMIVAPLSIQSQNPAAKTGIISDLNFETSSFMQKAAYHNSSHIAPENDLNADGAMSPVNRLWDTTQQGKWYIEEQRYGYDAIAAGLANNDTIAINRGLRIFNWGYKQQQPDGSFSCPDAFHSTSFFIEATAHSVLLLEASSYSKKYKSMTDKLKPKILKAALWMIQPEVETEGKQKNQPYTHRRYLVAAALGETAILTNNQDLLAKSWEYILEGIRLQDATGFNPEKGGYDCSYHAVGLVYAERYYDIVANEEQKKVLYKMLQKGINWLSTRVKEDGTLDATGNTRTGLGQEKGRNDTIKTLNYGQVFRAFYRWSLFSSDAQYEALALKIINGKKIDERNK
jgi:hypothetical protein